MSEIFPQMSSSQTNCLAFWIKVKTKISWELRNEMGKPYDFELKDHCHFMNKSQFAYQINLKCTYSLEMGFSFFICISIVHFVFGWSFVHFIFFLKVEVFPFYIKWIFVFSYQSIILYDLIDFSENFVFCNHDFNHGIE